MKLSQLEPLDVALWGWGREGHAAYRAIRAHAPGKPLTLFCAPGEVDDAKALGDANLHVETDATAERLSAFDVVIKSPGISPYKPEAMIAASNGTRFIGGTALWCAEHADADGFIANAACVTGTKGKSTTTALLAHLLRAGGHRAALAGNIGLPLLEVLEPQPAPDFWTIELSSYQTRDVARSGARPQVAVVLNIFPEHLDWHGSHEKYVEDKLALVTEGKPRIAVLNAADPFLNVLRLADSEVHWFNRADGWHLRGDDLYRGDVLVMDTLPVPLPGRHNRGNLCAALAAIEALGVEALPLARAALDFKPLPHRLQTLGEHDGCVFVNDSISTTPHATLAALDCFREQPVAVLVGGHDRGLPWQDFADQVGQHPPRAIVTMGANGPRIHELLAPLAQRGLFKLAAAHDLSDAVAQAKSLLGGAGVILLSPGAPSFGAYKDYVARGRHFAELGGFDPDAISSIPGLGVA
ncbi:MAG: UDP-N-acetylmuramoyl-L-alanine--D-glutamate ligase [Pseudoxanthomonas sp.]